MRKIIILFVLGLAVVNMAFSGSESEGGNKGTLTIYGGMQEAHVALMANEFEKRTGIKTSFVRMSSGEILARVKAEKNNVSASVWYGGPIDAIIAANEEGLIDTYVSPETANIRPEFKSEDGTWTGIYVGYLGFVGNQKLLAEKGASMPQSWEALLDPKLKGEIVVAHPGSSGTAYTMLSTVLQIMGEDEGFDYIKQFNGQVRQYTKSGSAPGRMVGQGEAAVGIVFLHDGIKFKKEGFTDIVLAAPSEGTGFEIGGVALLKNAPNPDAGKMFIDFALSKEGEELGQTVGSFQFLTNKDANPPVEAEPIKDTEIIDYNFDWAGKNRTRLVERFTVETSTTIPTK